MKVSIFHVWLPEDYSDEVLETYRRITAFPDASMVAKVWFDGAVGKLTDADVMYRPAGLLDIDCSDVNQINQVAEYAFEQTNHIDHPWQENPTVRWAEPRARSSSVGDVFLVDPGTGRLHLLYVDTFGFKEVPHE